MNTEINQASHAELQIAPAEHQFWPGQLDVSQKETTTESTTND